MTKRRWIKLPSLGAWLFKFSVSLSTEMYARRLGDMAATPCVRERARDMSMALGQGERGAPRRGGGEGPGRYGSHAVRQRASSRGQMLPDPKAQRG